MESNRRNVWIVVVVIVALLLCCCALVSAAALVGLFSVPSWSWGGFGLAGSESARIERTFEVGAAPDLKIDNFAGSVSVHAGERGEIRVVAIKKASLGANLDRIQVEMIERDGGLEIRTKRPAGLGNASVQFEITAPAQTRLDLHTGAGSIEVRGLSGGGRVDTGSGSVTLVDASGTIDVHSGAGSIEVRGAEGTITLDTGSGSVTMADVSGEIEAHTGSGSMNVRQASGVVGLDTGSGSIDYEGSLQGDCRFETGSGSIMLRLPADLSMTVDLDTGSGTIEVGYAVDGQVTRREVKGTIGSGDEGSIYAHTGTGNITLSRR